MNRAFRRANKNKQYTYLDKEGNLMGHIPNQPDFRIDKTAYAAYNKDNRENLNIFDDSWDVIHKDGDKTNCEISNLEYIEMDKTDEDITPNL